MDVKFTLRITIVNSMKGARTKTKKVAHGLGESGRVREFEAQHG
jgi:hypothetical protein